MPSAMRTIEQERANYAWQCIKKEVKGRTFAGDYRSIAVKTPSLILTNGLGQTLAFLRSKPEREHFARLYSHLSGWLQQKLNISNNDVLEWIVSNANSQQYRLATMEALAFLQWLKRFAEATLPKGGEE